MTDLVLDTYVLDNGLSVLHAVADKIYICSAQPTNYTEATATYALGVNDFGSAGAACGATSGGSPDGRQATSVAVTNGSVTGTGTAAYWAMVASSITQLLASGAFTGSGVVTSGQHWSLSAFTIHMPA